MTCTQKKERGKSVDNINRKQKDLWRADSVQGTPTLIPNNFITDFKIKLWSFCNVEFIMNLFYFLTHLCILLLTNYTSKIIFMKI